MRFNTLWEDLEVESRNISGHGTLKRRISTNSICPMFLGIRQPGSRRTFIIHVQRDLAPLPEALTDSKGFDFQVFIAGDETNPDYLSIILCASSSDYNDIFATICDDLFSKIRDLGKPREVVTTFLKIVHLWQRFFEKHAVKGLSIEAQKGLFGELYFLKNYVIPNCTKESGLRYWMGPENRQHDFQFGRTSVEVKTTSAKHHQILRIASEQQLDEDLVERLYIFYLSVSLIENGKTTLVALVDDIKKTLSEEASAKQLFDNKLLESGYSDAHRALYEHTGYEIRKEGFLEVRDVFPRIKEADIRKGVGDVRYSISLDSCSDYEVTAETFKTELERTLS